MGAVHLLELIIICKNTITARLACSIATQTCVLYIRPCSVLIECDRLISNWKACHACGAVSTRCFCVTGSIDIPGRSLCYWVGVSPTSWHLTRTCTCTCLRKRSFARCTGLLHWCSLHWSQDSRHLHCAERSSLRENKQNTDRMVLL